MRKMLSRLALGAVLMLNAVAAGQAWAQKKFDMEDGMTIVYRAQDPAMLQAVKAGDKVKFDAENVNGQFVVTKIEKAK
jgi:hypothetical protein